MRNVLKALGCALALTLVMSATASAQSATANKAQVFGELGYGIWMGEDTDDDFNPYGIGLNLGGGYTLDMGVYIGARLDYYLGDSEEAGGVEASTNIYQFGIEAGYDVAAGSDLVVRPQVGLGMATYAFESSGGGFDFDVSEGGISIAPGVAAIMDMGGFHLRGDLRYSILSVDVGDESFDASGLLLGVGAGASF